MFILCYYIISSINKKYSEMSLSWNWGVKDEQGNYGIYS